MIFLQQDKSITEITRWENRPMWRGVALWTVACYLPARLLLESANLRAFGAIYPLAQLLLLTLLPAVGSFAHVYTRLNFMIESRRYVDLLLVPDLPTPLFPIWMRHLVYRTTWRHSLAAAIVLLPFDLIGGQRSHWCPMILCFILGRLFCSWATMSWLSCSLRLSQSDSAQLWEWRLEPGLPPDDDTWQRRPELLGAHHLAGMLMMGVHMLYRTGVALLLTWVICLAIVLVFHWEHRGFLWTGSGWKLVLSTAVLPLLLALLHSCLGRHDWPVEKWVRGRLGRWLGIDA